MPGTVRLTEGGPEITRFGRPRAGFRKATVPGELGRPGAPRAITNARRAGADGIATEHAGLGQGPLQSGGEGGFAGRAPLVAAAMAAESADETPGRDQIARPAWRSGLKTAMTDANSLGNTRMGTMAKAREEIGLASRRHHQRVTLHEIAHAAGVSPTTVSNVVNGKYDLMAAETRASIEQLIEKMNYRPHAAGRSLRLNRRYAVGLIVIDDSPAFLADPFNTNLVAGLSNHLNRNGYSLVINGLPASAIDDCVLLRKHDTDALCLVPSGDEAERRRVFDRLAGAQQPVLVFQLPPPATLDDAASVRQDDAAGGAAVAGRLLERGARRLIMLVPRRQWPAMAERERGIRAVLADRGDVTFDLVECGSEGLIDTQKALAQRVVDHGYPDAVIGGNDQMGIAALKWAEAQGLAVPSDLMITGFNAFAFWQYSTPTLTTVRSSAYAMGERGAAMLLHRIENGAFPEREAILDVELAPGDSD